MAGAAVRCRSRWNPTRNEYELDQAIPERGRVAPIEEELTIEGRTDRISVYGSLELARYKAGLQLAWQLKAIVEAVVTTPEAEKHLAEQVPVKPAEKAKNPFTNVGRPSTNHRAPEISAVKKSRFACR